MIELVCAVIPFLYIYFLIPTIEEVQIVSKEINNCICKGEPTCKGIEGKCDSTVEVWEYEPGSWITSELPEINTIIAM